MTYFISDIHGELTLFQELLEIIGFSENDQMIVIGDMIDKGPDSIKLLRLLFSMPNVILIGGNHEYDFNKFCQSVLDNNPDAVIIPNKIKNYFPNEGKLLDWSIIENINNLRYYYETDTYICVHAGIPIDENGNAIPPQNAIIEQLVYDRRFKSPDFKFKCDKCVIFGHTPVRNINGHDKILAYRRENTGKQMSLSCFRKIHIDCGAFISGVLGCLCMETCQCYYARKRI